MITTNTKKAIQAAKNEDYIVSIVTGRPNRISENFYDDLSLDTPMINFNGSLGILPHSKWEREYEYVIDKDIVMDLLEKSKLLGITLLAVEGKQLFLASRAAKDGFGFFPSSLRTTEVLNQKSLKENVDNPITITVELVPEMKQAFINYVNQQFGDLVEVSPWGGPHPIVEVATKGIKKVTGVKRLADYYGVLQKDIIAFGDEANDHTMIDYAGLGVAMKNAIPSIKGVANDVTKYTNEQDGVARYMQEKLDIAVGI